MALTAIRYDNAKTTLRNPKTASRGHKRIPECYKPTSIRAYEPTSRLAYWSFGGRRHGGRSPTGVFQNVVFLCGILEMLVVDFSRVHDFPLGLCLHGLKSERIRRPIDVEVAQGKVEAAERGAVAACPNPCRVTFPDRCICKTARR